MLSVQKPWKHWLFVVYKLNEDLRVIVLDQT